MGIKNATARVTFNLVFTFLMGCETIICGRIFASVINEMLHFHAGFVRRCIIKRVLGSRGEMNE